MKPLLLSATVLAVLFSSSCTARISEIKSCLKEAERFISIAPDSSLSIMTSIDMTQINGKKLKAEASLLHSIALDKCHIDLKSDSIIAPALIYFSEKMIHPFFQVFFMFIIKHFYLDHGKDSSCFYLSLPDFYIFILFRIPIPLALI